MRVFLSSTYADLADHRRMAAEAVERLGQETSRMEVFGARSTEPVEACLGEIDQCELFVGIYAHRYGHVPEGSDISITEIEYKHACERSKPVFAFLVDEDYPWLPRMIDGEPARTKLSLFKTAIQNQRVRELFTTPEDLAFKVATSVGRRLAEVSAPLYPVVTGLRNLISESSAKEEADRLATADALSDAVDIASKTLKYIADRRSTGQRDVPTERALADGWNKAGSRLVRLKDPPVELAERYFIKAEYWLSPETWTDKRIAASKIGLEEIARESRLLLLSRVGAQPSAAGDAPQAARP